MKPNFKIVETRSLFRRIDSLQHQQLLLGVGGDPGLQPRGGQLTETFCLHVLHTCGRNAPHGGTADDARREGGGGVERTPTNGYENPSNAAICGVGWRGSFFLQYTAASMSF